MIAPGPSRVGLALTPGIVRPEVRGRSAGKRASLVPGGRTSTPAPPASWTNCWTAAVLIDGADRRRR